MNSRRRLALGLLVGVLLLGAVAIRATASDDAAPVLTEVQKLQLQNAVLSWKVAQLQAQAATRDELAARDALVRVATALDNRDGWSLDIQTMAYVPRPPLKDPDR